MGRLERDFQSQLEFVLAINDAEDCAEGAVGKELLYVKLITDLSAQQLRLEYVNVRYDGHGPSGVIVEKALVVEGSGRRLGWMYACTYGEQEEAFYIRNERGPKSASGWSRRRETAV